MRIYNYITIICSLIVFLLTLILNYNFLMLSTLPMVYLLSKMIIHSMNNKEIKYTKFIFDIYGFIRLVFIPGCIVIFNDIQVDNLPLGESQIDKGVVLICVEYIVGAIFLLILSSYKFNKNKPDINNSTEYQLLGSKFVYILFIIVSFILFLLFPSVRETVSFLIIRTDATGRGTEEATSLVVLIRMCIQLSLLLLFVMTSLHYYKKYLKNSKLTYMIVPLFIGLINISLIVGERRAIQLYTLISILVVTSLQFKRHKFKVNMLFIIFGAFILISMTIYKELYVFNFSSYSEALESKAVSNVKFVDQLQSYFYGPHNVGAAIDYLNYYTVSIKGFFYDAARSIAGLNFFVNENGLITSQLFNKLIYGNQQLTGHLISSAGYGYIYFGSILFPLVLLFNMTLAVIIEILVRHTNKLEIIFIGTFIYMRVATNIFGNPMPILNMLSSIIIVYGSVVLTAYLVKKLKIKVLI